VVSAALLAVPVAPDPHADGELGARAAQESGDLQWSAERGLMLVLSSKASGCSGR